MTLPLRTKRRTIRRVRSTLVQTAASWSGLLLLAGSVQAQVAPVPPPLPTPAVTQAGQTFTYQKKAQPAMATVSFPAPLLPAAPLPPVPPPRLQPVRFQPAGAPPGTGPSPETPRHQVKLEPPGPQELFQLESEAQLRERMRQEARERVPLERIAFPDEPVVSRETYQGRHWPPSTVVVEPNYVCHGRLLFEQINGERYGWDLGPLHPFLSTVAFVKDAITLPYHLGTFPCRKYECSAGLCLPGDPVPFLIYPPELTATGLLSQAVMVGALIAIFP